MFDPFTQCPDCGALLVVNVRGHRQFTCGREDVFDGHAAPAVLSVTQPCRTSAIAEELGGAVVVTGRLVTCPACGCDNEPMGALGAIDHYRCRDCGMEYSS